MVFATGLTGGKVVSLCLSRHRISCTLRNQGRLVSVGGALGLVYVAILRGLLGRVVQGLVVVGRCCQVGWLSAT